MKLTYKLTFLESFGPSFAKTYERLPDGSVDRELTDYPLHVTTHVEEVEDIQQMHDVLVAHAKVRHGLLRGPTTRALRYESRAQLVDRMAPTNWLCLDIDGVDEDCNPEALLAAMGIGDVMYILHWSGSYLLKNNKLRYHLFIQMDGYMQPALLKQWMTYINMDVELLKVNIRLTDGKGKLHWPMDLTLADNTRLIFIAEPTLKGIDDPLQMARPKIPRFKLVTKGKGRMRMPVPTLPMNVTEIDKKANGMFAALRKAEGLPESAGTIKAMKMDGQSIDVLKGCAPGIVTGVRDIPGKDWVYLNLNGGDSWGYYYHRNNPKLIRNFKDEPLILLSEFDRAAYDAAVAKGNNDLEAYLRSGVNVRDDRTFLVIRDLDTQEYLHGWQLHETGEIKLWRAKDLTQANAWCLHYNIKPYGERVPPWLRVFNPQSFEPNIDEPNHTLNMFQPTIYMHDVAKKSPGAIPPATDRLLDQLFSGDQAAKVHFINWLAYIVQYRDRPQTAWLFQGTQGTGKGTLSHRILGPLFGKQWSHLGGEALEEATNEFARDKLILVFDEVQLSSARHAAKVQNRLNGLITEPTLSLRAMYKGMTQYPNHNAVIFLSNKGDAFKLATEDRRWNIAPFQSTKYLPSDDELALIDSERQAFYDYLFHYKVDMHAVRTPLKTAARNEMMHITVSNEEEVLMMVMGMRNHVNGSWAGGNMQALLDLMPYGKEQKPGTSMDQYFRDAALRRTLGTLLRRGIESKAEEFRVSRDEMGDIFNVVLAKPLTTATSITQMFRKLGIDKHDILVDGKQQVCIITKWVDRANFQMYWDTYFAGEQLAASAQQSKVVPIHTKKGN